MIDKWEIRFKRLRLFGWLALAGVPFIALAAITSDFWEIFGGVAAFFLILPGFIYVYVLVILHWKGRYRGRHSDLWGVLILIETSGWMKLVYIFRHIVPDMRQSGRYRLAPEPERSDFTS
jgi:hypothetical protein